MDISYWTTAAYAINSLYASGFSLLCPSLYPVYLSSDEHVLHRRLAVVTLCQSSILALGGLLFHLPGDCQSHYFNVANCISCFHKGHYANKDSRSILDYAC